MATVKITSTEELSFALNKIGRIAMDNALERLKSDIVDGIERGAYNSYDPIFYTRTEDLLQEDNWVITRAYKYRRLVGEIAFDESKLTHDYAGFVHHGIDSSTLLGILNGDIKVGDICNFPTDVGRHGFWDSLQPQLEENFRDYLLEEMTNLGLKIK